MNIISSKQEDKFKAIIFVISLKFLQIFMFGFKDLFAV